MNEKVIILDFGSQYTQLIARRIRELNVYCEIQPYNQAISWTKSIKAVVLSGSPWSVHGFDSGSFDVHQLLEKVPVMGICFGAQLTAQQFGGGVERSNKREYGRAHLHIEKEGSVIIDGIDEGSQVWMSHGDTISRLPDGFEVIGSTEDIPVAIFASKPKVFANPIYCLQFHPEVTHTKQGKKILSNFLMGEVGMKGDWTPGVFIEDTLKSIREQVGEDQVIIAMSGGVDSSVAGVLLDKAIGHKMHGIFIDNGLLRKDEFQEVIALYKDLGLNVRGIDARKRFWDALKGVSDPETKRKIIGGVFIDVFQEEALKINNAKWLAQGTIYPDVIESISVHGPSATIKSHHNVGGLPEKMHLKLLEPLNTLFKDEVRLIGKALEMPSYILDRHPFPGPGLGIRILGDVTEEKVDLLQKADEVYINLLKKHGWYHKVWQACTILLPIQSVGVMGDERTYERTIVIRAVNSMDGMTAEWSRLPHEILAEISSEIINSVNGINRVVYDISTKPPATIEWE